jgi:hypothetical protein
LNFESERKQKFSVDVRHRDTPLWTLIDRYHH